MGRKRKQKTIEGATITDMAAKGKGFFRHDGKVIFVEDGVPGDVVDVRLKRNKRDYAIGEITQLHQASTLRAKPFCAHFGTCGGCKWQYLPYDMQLRFKSQIVEEAFKHIGRLTFPPLNPILGSEPNRYYRNRLDFSCSNKRWLTTEEIASGDVFNRDAIGFHKPGMFDKVIDVEHCYLQGGLSNDIRNAVRAYAIEKQLTYYDVREHQGFLRSLIIRTSTLDELMVVVMFGEENEVEREALLTYLASTFPSITSLQYVINTKKNDTFYDLDIVVWKGRDYIFEQLEDKRYKISPKSFFQTNPFQAEKLYQLVREKAQLSGKEIVYDLYTGTGSIAIFIAAHCQKVVGIEEVPAAIEDAQFNASLNNVDNTVFYAGDVKTFLDPQFISANGTPDLLITDPPRAGMHADVVQKILAMAPPRIIYVSCNPATQARDLQLLSEKYQIEEVQPVDMFPHTYHVENIAVLKRNDI